MNYKFFKNTGFYSSFIVYSLSFVLNSSFIVANAQQHKVDSVLAILKMAKEDTVKVNTLNELSLDLYAAGKQNVADSLANLALSLAQNLHYLKGGMKAYAHLGIFSWSRGDYPEALANQLNALKIASALNDKRDMAKAYGNIGNIYADQQVYDTALKYLFQAKVLFQETGNMHGLSAAYGAIGTIYHEEGYFKEAMDAQQKSLDISLKIGNTEGIGKAYTNMANVFDAENKYNEALAYQMKALKIARETGDNNALSIIYTNIQGEMANLKKFSLAALYRDSCLALAKKMHNTRVLRDCYRAQVQVDTSESDYKTAFKDYVNYTIFKDSLINESSTKKLLQEQMQYEFDKRRSQEQAEQAQKDAVAEADKKKQRIISLSIASGLLLALIFAGFVMRSLKIARKQKNIIELQKEEVEKKNEVIEVQKKLVEEKNKDILDSITYAKRLQDAILPPQSVFKTYLPESFLLYKPKDIVAGDFYWMEKVNDTVLVAACDCTGHGVPGAMVSVVCSNALNRALNEFKLRDTGKILDKVRDLVLETFGKSSGEVKDGMDCSFCAINTKTKKVEWSGAYNSLWYVENGEMKEITGDKQPIGQTDNPKLFTTHTLSLSGSTLYLFTDGYADQFGGPKGKKFKYQQLKDKLSVISDRPMEEQKKILEETFNNWKGSLEQVDDILIIGIRV